MTTICDIHVFTPFQIDNTQTNKILELIESGKAQGAKLVAGGKRIGGNKSNFVEPTVFADVKDDMRIAQEEVNNVECFPFTFKIGGFRGERGMCKLMWAFRFAGGELCFVLYC